MKKLFFFAFLLILSFSCKKIEEAKENESVEETTYTDSFSPSDWENPAGRSKVDYEDKDIKKIIKPGSGNQKQEKIYQLFERFFNDVKNKNNDDVQKILTSAAFNSYQLRIPAVAFDKKYILRIALPEDIEKDKLWVTFKLLFNNIALISKIEIEKTAQGFIITDIEGKFFTELEEILTNKKK